MLGLYLGLPIGSTAGSGSFSPTDIAGLQFWVEASQGITLNGPNVSQWDDLSGNGNHLTQGTPADQPLYVVSGINGRPSVSFNGTSHYMIADAVSSVFSGNDENYTMFSVTQKTNTVGFDSIIGVGSSLSGTPFVRHAIEPNLTNDRIDSTIRDDVAASTNQMSNVFTRTDPHFLTIASNGTQLQYYVDGGIDLLVPFNVGAITLDRFAVGALRRRDADPIQDFFDGLMGEILIYNRLLTAGEINQIHTYLSL